MEKENNLTCFEEYISEYYPLNLIRAIHPNVPEEITADIHAGLECILTTLSPREQEILRLRYREKKIRADIGEEFCITQSRVRQIEGKALKKLRQPSRFQFIRLGLMGYIRHIRKEEFKSGYDKGYDKGYKNGMEDAAKGKTFKGVSAETTAIDINDLELSVRAYNSLLRMGCRTIGDCMLLKEDQILNMKNLGRITRDEIACALHKYEVYDTIWDKFILK